MTPISRRPALIAVALLALMLLAGSGVAASLSSAPDIGGRWRVSDDSAVIRPASDFVVAAPVEVRGPEIHVHGGSHGAGTVSSPANIHQAIFDSREGCTTLRLRPGFYPPTRISGRSCLTLIGPEQGTASFRSHSLDREAGLWIEDSEDIAIQGVEVADSLWGVQVVRSSRVTIAGGHFADLGQEAIRVRDDSTAITITDNHIHHTGTRPGSDPEQGLPYRTFGEGIYIGTGGDESDGTNDVTIAGNHIHHTGSEAIDIKPGTRDVRVRRNIIHDLEPRTTGAVVAHVGTAPSADAGIEIVGNVIWSIRSGSEFADGNAIVMSAPGTVRANVIWDTEHRGVFVEDVVGADRPVVVVRNVIFETGFSPVDVAGQTPQLESLDRRDNIGPWPLDTDTFADGWIIENQPTEALALLIELLEGDTPIDRLGEMLRGDEPAATTPESAPVAPEPLPAPTDRIPERDEEAAVVAADLAWWEFTERSDEPIALGRQVEHKFLGQFRTQCSFSHFGYDDPLRAPGRPASAPLRMFFGNTDASADSTYSSLRDSGNSTCNGLEGNRSSYAIPAVFDGVGNVRIPSRIEIHYGSHSDTWDRVIAPPPGLGMTAGSAGSNPHVEWACEEAGAVASNADRPLQQRQDTIPRCSLTATLLAHVQFPNCLGEGVRIGSAPLVTINYPESGFFHADCPAGTRYMTAIEFYIAWAPDNHDGRTDEWWLSSDVGADGQRAPNGSTLYGDWFGAWNPDLIELIHANCVARLAECGWDTVHDRWRLARVEHFGPRHPVAYDGPFVVAATDVAEQLCPGEASFGPIDASWCGAGASGVGPPAARQVVEPAVPIAEASVVATPAPTGATTIPVYDTAWQMLVRGTEAQADTYFATLAAHGFTGAWAGVIHHSPATYVDNYNGGGQVGRLVDGRVELSDGYKQHVRRILDAADRHGQKVGLVVAWQNTYLPGGATESGHRAQVHGTIHTGNAYAYGRQMVEAFGDHPAVSMWVFGGDAGHNNTDANKAVWRQMAQAVRDSGNGVPINYHTPTSANEQGTFRQLNYVGEWWLDMVAPETGHQQSPEETERELRAAVAAYDVPVWQGEPRYYNITFDWIRPEFRNPGVNEVRADAIAAARAGVSGYVYGDAGRWNWCGGFGDTSPCDANDIAASFGPGEQAVLDVFRHPGNHPLG